MDNLTPPYDHKDPLPPAIVNELEGTYKRLSREDLLNHWLIGYTQNQFCSSREIHTKRVSHN